jgi:hypothetical protein
MNTFLNLSHEIKCSDLTKAELMSIFFSLPLHERITSRGGREQFASVLLTHYYPNENIAKRKRRGTTPYVWNH